MPDSPKPSRWNSLLESLGLPTPAAPPPAAETPPPRPAAPPPVREKPAPKAKPAARPARNWGSIAGELGLEVPPEPVAPQPPSPRPAPPPPPRVERPRPASVEPPPPAPPPPAAARTPLDDIFGEKDGDVDVFGLSSGREERRPFVPPPPRIDEDDDEGPVLDYDIDSESDLLLDEELPAKPADRSDERSPREAARGPRSAEEGEQEGGRRRRRRRGRGRGGRRDEGPREEGRRDEGRRDEGRIEAQPRPSSPPSSRKQTDDDLLPPADELDDVFVELDELDDEAPPRPAPPVEARGEGDDRGRGRGRGRRGRGGRSGEGRTAEGRSGEGRVSEGRGGEGRTADERLPRREARPARDVDRLDIPDEDDRSFTRPPARSAGVSDELDLDIEGGGDDESEHLEGHSGHKKIPTWQEAIGVLIDANMAARANSPDRGHGGQRGRRGGGRGGR